MARSSSVAAAASRCHSRSCETTEDRKEWQDTRYCERWAGSWRGSRPHVQHVEGTQASCLLRMCTQSIPYAPTTSIFAELPSLVA